MCSNILYNSSQIFHHRSLSRRSSNHQIHCLVQAESVALQSPLKLMTSLLSIIFRSVMAMLLVKSTIEARELQQVSRTGSGAVLLCTGVTCLYSGWWRVSGSRWVQSSGGCTWDLVSCSLDLCESGRLVQLTASEVTGGKETGAAGSAKLEVLDQEQGVSVVMRC